MTIKRNDSLSDDELRQRVKQLEIVQQIDHALLTAATVPDMATAVLQHIRPILPAIRISIITFDHAEQTATFLTAMETEQEISITTNQMPLAQLRLADTFYQDEMIVVEDFSLSDQVTKIEQAVFDAGVRAFISVPLLIQGQLAGFFNLGMNSPQKFSNQQLRLAREIAHPLCVAIRQAHLLAKEHEQRTLAETLTEITLKLSSPTSRTAVLNEILQQAQKLVPHRAASLLILDENKLYTMHASGYEQSDSQEFIGSLSQTIDQLPSLDQEAIKSGQPYVIPDTTQVDKWVVSPQTTWIQSYLALPIRKQEQTLGLLRIDGHVPKQFSQRDIQHLQPLVNVAAIALENSQLFETLEKRLAELEAVRRAGLSIISSLKIQAVLQTILKELFELFEDVTNTHIFLYDGDWLTFGAAFWDGTYQQRPISQPRKDGLTYEVARTGQMLIVPEMETHPLYAKTELTNWAKSIIGLPLIIGERVVGVMNIAFKKIAQPTDLSALKLLADQAAIAIENARLYGQMQQEIRERHQVEAALRYSEERYRRVSELTSDFAYGLYVYPDRSIKIDWITDVFTRITGYSLSEWDDQVWMKMVHPQDKAIIRQRTKAIYEGQSFVSEFRIITKSKETRWLRDHIQPVQAADVGVTNYVFGASQDITEQKQIAEAMMNAQKLEGLGVVASGIAHDFNNALTAVITQASNALLHLPEHHPARQNIQQIAQISENATGLTRQLLIYAGEAQYQLSPLDLNKTVSDLIPLLKSTITKSISLSAELTPDLPHVLADSGQIQQVIMNLVVNAAEAYDGSTGEVKIATYLAETAVSSTSQTTADNTPAVCLSVSDTGRGMDQETADRIYDPFFSTKFQGRGLGMAAVQGIVRAHRGEIGFTTAVQQGTAFVVQLPAAFNLPPVSAPTSPSIVAPLSATPELVLIIDDEDVVRTALVEFLQLRGYEVLAANNGRTGIDLFQQHQDKISLILLDMTMPVMSGIETFGHLRPIAPHIPVLFLSGLNEPEELLHYIGQKGIDFLKKPFRLDHLIKKMEGVMAV